MSRIPYVCKSAPWMMSTGTAEAWAERPATRDPSTLYVSNSTTGSCGSAAGAPAAGGSAAGVSASCAPTSGAPIRIQSPTHIPYCHSLIFILKPPPCWCESTLSLSFFKRAELVPDKKLAGEPAFCASFLKNANYRSVFLIFQKRAVCYAATFTGGGLGLSRP